MTDFIKSLCGFSFSSVIFRLLLAAVSGGVIGVGRAQKKQTAGLRTYMITSIGASLTMLISLYEYEMLYNGGSWAADASEIKYDAARFSASVISGIGFLAAGSIIRTLHRQISGLTTAIGLFASACMGIAAGAGFYEGVIMAVVFIVFTLEVMQPLETAFKRRIRNVTLYVEFESLEDLDAITRAIGSEKAKVFDIEMDRSDSGKRTNPAAILTIKLSKENSSHSAILSSVAELECVSSVQEIIS